MIDPIKIRLSVDVTDAADSVAEFVRNTRNALETQVTSSVEKAKAKIEEYARSWQNVNKIIDDNKKRIEELSAASQKASGEEKRRIDQELDGLKKVTNARELELIRIEEKKNKATEAYALSISSTEEERNAIKRTTDALNQQTGARKDELKAVSNVTEEVEKGTSAVGRYIQQFMGIGGVVLLMRQLAEFADQTRRQVEAATGAAGVLRDKSLTEADRLKPFFQEFGLHTASEKNAGQTALQNIASTTGLEPATVQQTAGNIAAMLKDQGVSDVSGGRGADLVTQASIAQFNGIDTSNLRDIFDQNKGITGAGLNAKIGQVLAVTGSPSRANSFLQAYSQNRIRLEAGGLGFEDSLKLYQAMAQRMAPSEVPEQFGQFASALDKFAFGKTMQERQGVATILGQAGASDAINVLLGSQQVDAKKMFAALAKLPQASLNQAAQGLAMGSRGGVMLAAAAHINDQVLPAGTSNLQGPVTQAEITKAQMGLAQGASAVGNQPDPYAERVRQEMEIEGKRLLAHPDQLPALADPNSFVGNLAWISGKRQPTRFAELQAKAVVDAKINAMTDMINEAAANGVSGDILQRMFNTQAKLMQLVNGTGDVDKLIDPNHLAPLFREADEEMNQLRASYRPTTRPTTQPSGPRPVTRPTGPGPALPTGPATQPTSINYHIRNVNYGHSYDSIGAPTDYETRYG